MRSGSGLYATRLRSNYDHFASSSLSLCAIAPELCAPRTARMAGASLRRRQAVHPKTNQNAVYAAWLKMATRERRRPCTSVHHITGSDEEPHRQRRHEECSEPVNSERPNFLSLASANVYISRYLGKGSNAVRSSRFFLKLVPRLLWSLFGSLFHLPYEKLNVNAQHGW
jgi:hypothetical protein